MENYKKAYIAGGWFSGDGRFILECALEFIDTEVGYLGGQNDQFQPNSQITQVMQKV